MQKYENSLLNTLAVSVYQDCPRKRSPVVVLDRVQIAIEWCRLGHSPKN